ncbi:MAG: D-glycero-beta-D-manno-heptose-7-phosphate kinase, partial [Candidatus Marinimicrobia bacterium]|nr:D-glycero-beta-D-manno-heptose-7-phosphate kinase [Candidatus Neomarinimicrobiota bacterium]
MNIQNNRIKEILDGFSEKNILVIGDLMLDAYFWGKTERISPEAPVPIVEIQRTYFNPGGAGNVALNLAALGSEVSVLAVIGNDTNGDTLLNQLKKVKIEVSPIIVLDNYQTPIKTRVIAQDQQVIRIDQENNPINSKLILLRITESLEKNIEKFDGIILADYNKGLFSKDIINLVLNKANALSIPVYVDPKWDNFFEYKNVHFFKPNAMEFQKAVGNNYQEDNFIKHGNQMREKLNTDILLVTKGSEAAVLFTEEGNNSILTEEQGVHDVSGAG